MANAIEDAFTTYHADWARCEECSLAIPILSGLFRDYAKFATHMRSVFEARGVKLTFSGDSDAHFTSTTNTINLPHSGKAAGVDDLVDALIFESFNSIRKDDFIAASGLSDRFDLLGHGQLTATIESGTMADFYEMAVAFAEKDRTANMKKCMLRAREATGSIAAHFLASPHAGDPEKVRTLDPGDERRLPTGHVYIYQNIVNASTIKIRCVIQTLANVSFEIYKTATRFPTSEVRVTATAAPLKAAAERLDALVKKNWPSASFKNRPAALLGLIAEVQSNDAYAPLRGTITKVAFGITAEMVSLAAVNNPGFALKP